MVVMKSGASPDRVDGWAVVAPGPGPVTGVVAVQSAGQFEAFSGLLQIPSPQGLPDEGKGVGPAREQAVSISTGMRKRCFFTAASFLLIIIICE
jgi:hypothetical protein